MTSRRRNLAIIALVVALLAGAAIAIAEKSTRLGLDLSGGVELVYEGQPTPQVPEVTPQAIDDAIETIRKRTDALGVSEPEIQSAASNQISVGLPNVENVDQAIEQVGTTAQLQFYDWEPNVFTSIGPLETLTEAQAGGNTQNPDALTRSLEQFEAVERATEAKPTADAEDLPPGGADPAELPPDVTEDDEEAVQEFYDRQNDSQSSDQYYLFGADEELIAGPAPTCEELFSDIGEADAGAQRQASAGSDCREQLASASTEDVPEESQVLVVPRGILVIQAQQSPDLPADAPARYQIVEDDSELSGDDVRNPEQNFDPQTNSPIVTFEFSDEGQQAFAAVTKRIAERGAQVIPPAPGTPPEVSFQRFAITLDDELISLATIDFIENPEGIDGRTGASIENIGTLEETQSLAESLRIGALPIDLELISNTQVSASLGQQALDQGLLAGLAGLLLTVLFLIAFYRVLGAVAAATLITYAVFLFVLVKLIPITLTLPGIAGLILTLGVAADANIVIFERIKEEARAGRSIPAAITAGYAKALRTIVDANVVTIGVAFILFTLATAGVKGFAFTLGVGTLVSLFTAVLATSAILGSISRSRILRSRHALGAGKERSRWGFDFMGKSRWFFSASGAIIAAGALAIAGLGLNFGIDFESGTRIQTPLEEAADVDEVRAALPPEFQDAEVQAVDAPELGENVVQIGVPQLQPDQQDEVRDALDQAFGVDPAQFSTNSIGPTFGAQIAQTAVIAVIASLLLISLYIGVRFEFKFAVPVLIALAHDLLITAGVYALTEREVTSSTVAALLTILGYSLYDTIIVFDRIRENVPRMPRATFSQIVNRSMSEVLTRSLVTSFSTLLPITALMLFGGETLRDFGFALLVGVASGAYSSVFIASPVLSLWKEREPIYRRRRRLALEDHGGVVPAFAGAELGARDDDEAERPEAEPAPARRARRRAGRARKDGAQRERLGRAASTTTGDEGDDGGRAAPPSPEPATGGTAAPTPDSGGDGGDERAADDAPEPRVTSTAGARSPKSTSGDNRRRKKHGRR
ncbi:MAG: protein translocase subunit SecF [Thermoleophilaceae bacterium]